MGEEIKAGCARPTGGLIGEPAEAINEKEIITKKEGVTMIKVGKKAPDFTAPGDFTFV